MFNFQIKVHVVYAAGGVFYFICRDLKPFRDEVLHTALYAVAEADCFSMSCFYKCPGIHRHGIRVIQHPGFRGKLLQFGGNSLKHRSCADYSHKRPRPRGITDSLEYSISSGDADILFIFSETAGHYGDNHVVSAFKGFFPVCCRFAFCRDFHFLYDFVHKFF